MTIIFTGLISKGGRSATPFAGHVRVCGDWIETVVPAKAPENEDVLRSDAERIIDAQGSAIAPDNNVMRGSRARQYELVLA